MSICSKENSFFVVDNARRNEEEITSFSNQPAELLSFLESLF